MISNVNADLYVSLNDVLIVIVFDIVHNGNVEHQGCIMNCQLNNRNVSQVKRKCHFKKNLQINRGHKNVSFSKIFLLRTQFSSYLSEKNPVFGIITMRLLQLEWRKNKASVKTSLMRIMLKISLKTKTYPIVARPSTRNKIIYYNDYM